MQRLGMQVVRALVGVSVPGAIALIAYLNARGLSAMVEWADADARAHDPNADANPDAKEPRNAPANERSADAILDRNPFDHLTGALRAKGIDTVGGLARDLDPRTAPLCEGVRPLVLVGDEDQSVAFASLEFAGKRVLRRRGGDVGDRRVAYVGRDRIWLEGTRGLCQALLFGAPPDATTSPHDVSGTPPTPLEADVAAHVVQTGPTEWAIDHPTLDRILESQAGFGSTRVVPEKEGERLVGIRLLGVKPGSVLALVGLQSGDRIETINGFEVADPQRALEACGRLRLADRLTIHLTRSGRALDQVYDIR